eukprot:148646-Alexandrium_andersonii.AAC.1
MSASLVGSEMCIRDSGWGAGLGLSTIPDCGEGRLTPWACWYHGLLRLACLLYTSDAADDM